MLQPFLPGDCTGPSFCGHILHQAACYIQLLQRSHDPSLCITAAGVAVSHFSPVFFQKNIRTWASSFCSRAKRRCAFPIVISSFFDTLIYQNATHQNLQAKIKHGDDGKIGWGELREEVTSTEHMHHAIPVIL